jgi:hypothetical protein
MNITARIETNIVITPQDIDDIMITALEGGINYWCNRVEVIGDYLGRYPSEQISRGGTLRLYESDDGIVFDLTQENFLEGVKMYMEEVTNSSNILDTNEENEYCIDPSNVDAIVADAIIQFAVAGYLMYG